MKTKIRKKENLRLDTKIRSKGTKWTLIAPGVQLEEGLFWVACTWPRPAFY